MKPASTEVAARFGENLRRCRERAGLCQEELGYRCLLHRTHIGCLERGEKLPRTETLSTPTRMTRSASMAADASSGWTANASCQGSAAPNLHAAAATTMEVDHLPARARLDTRPGEDGNGFAGPVVDGDEGFDPAAAAFGCRARERRYAVAFTKANFAIRRGETLI
jgi:DNA-binding XRE family transcriptional regulator